MNKQQVSIYGLRCPLEDCIRYVGKSKNPKLRFRQHVSTKFPRVSLMSEREKWIKELHKKGLKPSLEILELVDDDQWQEAEMRWISKLQGNTLLNRTKGGDGGHDPNGKHARQRLLEEIKKQPESTIRELQKACGFNHVSVADYHLMKLMASGKLRKIPMRWEIVDKE